MIPVKITRVVTQLGKLRVRFHVKFDIESSHREFDFNDNLYTSLNYSTFLTWDILSNNNTSDMSQSIMITERNIFSVISTLNSMVKKLYKHDIYAYEDDRLIIYEDEAKKHTLVSKLYGSGVIMFKPTIVYDENETSYEGVALYINNTGNIVELPIEALESLTYTMTHIDFFTYSQALVNYYMSYYGINVNNPMSKGVDDKPNTKRIDWSEPASSTTTANFRRGVDEMDKLFNMK